MIGRLASALKGRRFNYDNEAELQIGIAQALREAGISFQQERCLGQDRVDFFLPQPLHRNELLLKDWLAEEDAKSGGIAVEVKVAGSVSAVTRQLLRYAYYPEVTELVLLTTKVQHRQIPRLMNGKTVRVIHLGLAVL